ncbi:hypothetical protein [Echinicola shivajiensis]|uniref:hypothetical protein n=1 Tax=Echinicola shivajiensis TaxID=1035916 RepID=UPI001BFC76B7|nr:hypothetical protein [Echinicola shivajiensis]
MENENKKIRRYTVFAQALAGAAVLMFLFPIVGHFTLDLEYDFKEYAAFVGGTSGPLGALAGFIFVYIAFQGQQDQFNYQKGENSFFTYFELVRESKKSTYYGNNYGEKAIDEFLKNLKAYIAKEEVKLMVQNGEDGKLCSNDERLFKKAFIVGVEGSSFYKSGQYDNFLNMINGISEHIVKYEDFNKVPILGFILSRNEKVLMLYSNYFHKNQEYISTLINHGLLKDIRSDQLIYEPHKYTFNINEIEESELDKPSD